jgi:hypothetical protein
MPSKAKLSPAQYGGNILSDVRTLAIPFSLLLAKNGVEYLMHKSGKTPASKTVKARTPKPKSPVQKKKVVAPKAKKQSGGADNAAMNASIGKLAADIKSLLARYN